MRSSSTPSLDGASTPSASVTYDVRRLPPKALAPLFDLLRSSDAPLPLASARAALEDIELDAVSLKSAVRETQGRYARSLVFRNAIAEVLVLTWMPGQSSPIHDHGASTCLVRIVSGIAHERVYARKRDGVRTNGRPRIFQTGEIAVQTHGDIHTLGNERASDETLITLHLYFPPLTSMQRF
jgi:predicted metal-dependent enzyme (double-stranded beta helix superfamily)